MIAIQLCFHTIIEIFALLNAAPDFSRNNNFKMVLKSFNSLQKIISHHIKGYFLLSRSKHGTSYYGM